METFESRIEAHQPLVISLATQIHKRLPRFITYEDILSYGQVGLAQASRTYQPQPGTKFSSYAYYRIKGAIYDGIARMNWTTRAEYRKYKAMQMANSAVSENSQDSGSSEPESDAKWFSRNVESLAMVYVFSSADSDDPIENQLLGDGVAPDEAAENNELCQKLHEAVEKLPDDEKKLVTMTYFQGQSLAEAASQLGKSRSWGSRTHAKILKTLGADLLGSADP
jgi:RNA polymerase sigma factor for flagellar operon FliA